MSGSASRPPRGDLLPLLPPVTDALFPTRRAVSEDYHTRGFELFGQNIVRVIEQDQGALNAWRGRGED
jgi:hypothetical protein